MASSFESKRFGFPVLSLVDRVGAVRVNSLVSRSTPTSWEVIHTVVKDKGKRQGKDRRRDEGKERQDERFDDLDTSQSLELPRNAKLTLCRVGRRVGWVGKGREGRLRRVGGVVVDGDLGESGF